MGSTVNKIEQIIENVLDNVNRGQKLSIPFSRRAKPRAGRVIQKSQSRGFVSFPGKTEAESKLFTQVLSILQLSHQALLSGTFVTKRNIFYQYRELFRDQRVVDGLVDDIAYTLSLGRDSLNISKGYPTLVTRWFLHHIHESAPRLPIYGLVDYDPHGVRIFRTYKYGSQSLSHETNTTVPGMKWLGIQSCDLMYPANSVSPRHWSALDDVLPLTDADRRTAACLLKDMVYNANVGTEESSYEQIREVQVMLMLNVKAEIQAADDYGDLAEWLDEKLYRAQEGDMEEMY
ncbi:endodeoxyribonuclease [Sporothrix stenoceras]